MEPTHPPSIQPSQSLAPTVKTSELPSLTPSEIVVYPLLEVDVLIAFSVEAYTIPTDPTELATTTELWKSAYEDFVPASSSIISVAFSYEADGTTTLVYTIQKIFTCTTLTCEERAQDVEDFRQECEDLSVIALQARLST